MALDANSFWKDLAEHLLTKKTLKDFVTSNFTLAVSMVNEAALAIALIDLPFKEESHGFKTQQGRGIEIKAASNMIVFLKEIQEA
jgi:hypothetical protein